MSYIDPLIIFFLLYAVLAWRSLPVALSVLVGLLPAYLLRFSIGPIPGTALEGMILIAAAFGLLAAWRDRTAWPLRAHRLRTSSFFLPGILLVLSSLIACFVAPDLRAALGIWRAYFVEPFLVYLMIIDTCLTAADRQRLVNGLGMTVLGLTAIADVQRLTGWWSPTWEWAQSDTQRVTALFTSPNALGLFVVPVAMLHLSPILLAIKTATRPLRFSKQLWFSLAVVFASIACVLFAVSRGAMIAFALSSFFIAYKQWSKKAAFIVATAGMLLLLLVPQVRTQVRDLASFQTASGQSRINLYRGSMMLLKQHPLGGTGLAGFATAFESVRQDQYTEKLIYPHNIFLNFWTETGILGLLVVIAIMIRVALLSRLPLSKTQDGWMRDAVTAALLAMLVHGLVDVPYFKNDLAVLTWVMLGLLASVIPAAHLSSQKRGDELSGMTGAGMTSNP